MNIKYPDGSSYDNEQNSLNYSSNSKRQKTIFGDRGMTLEEELNRSNEYYRAHEIAVIYKKPVPLQIVKVDYPKRSKAVVKEAYFRQPSTTDYNGIYQGKYIDFEAKETKNKTAFPLKNFHSHQIEHLRSCLKQGGICFVIMRFSTLNEYYILPASILIKYWDLQKQDGKKSIEYNIIVKNSVSIEPGYNPVLPYLEACDKMIDKLKGTKNGRRKNDP
ncbi:Holliday junction resolvase RecU [Companilactobacillus sp. RD055328]|uniref:Holliday junction resolvase RecU n=1 Tax=Companilactobacillus sp. RD055328 TaxID=2916634 RepID=UPI001FC88933|nr:Holliday junction resolvase RecU [Companilactobacillus sp. RD055328]GKQ42687.1 Holliday junction resolvase RecU [Companilactobacillus sp. RD055328]